MDIFRIQKIDMMGFTSEETFFSNFDEALKQFKKTLRNYRSDYLVKKDQVQHLSNPIVRNKDFIFDNNKIAEYMVELWYKCSYEYDEWDTMVEHLILEKIEIK